MNIIFIIITILWLLEFIIFPSKDKSEDIKNSSFSIILKAILLIIIINGIMLYFHKYIRYSRSLKIIAIMIYFSGLILRYYSLILLGKNFSRNVEVDQEQELVSTGTYKYVRHPLYLGLFLLVIAIPLYVGNIYLFLISIVLMFKVINIRIEEEEEAMEKIIGARYVRWKNKRYKFIPFIF